MKNVKKEFIIIGSIFVLLLVYLIFANGNKTNYQTPVLKEIKDSEVTKMVLTRSDGVITLELTNKEWKIVPQGYLADISVVNDWLRIAGSLKFVSLVSESKSYNMYGLDDQSKFNLKIYKGPGIIRDIDIGAASPTLQHTFVKLTSKSEVYQAKDSFRAQFDKKLDDIRDKIVMKLDQNSVTTLLLQNQSGKTLEAKKEKELPAASPTNTNAAAPVDVWKTGNGQNLAIDKVNEILSSMTSMNCSRYINDKVLTDYSSTKPIYIITVKGIKDYSLKIITKVSNEYVAISSDSSYPFILPDWQTEKIMKKFEELILKK